MAVSGATARRAPTTGIFSRRNLSLSLCPRGQRANCTEKEGEIAAGESVSCLAEGVHVRASKERQAERSRQSFTADKCSELNSKRKLLSDRSNNGPCDGAPRQPVGNITTPRLGHGFQPLQPRVRPSQRSRTDPVIRSFDLPEENSGQGKAMETIEEESAQCFRFTCLAFNCIKASFRYLAEHDSSSSCNDRTGNKLIGPPPPGPCSPAVSKQDGKALVSLFNCNCHRWPRI